MPESNTTAIILLGHGSRLPDSGQAMEKVARLLKEKFGHSTVEIGHMSLQQPDFESVLSCCISKGADHVVVIPYFLHEGVHMREDIPHMMQEFAKAHPGVRLVLGKGLGFDPLIADILHKRIEESRSMDDVRGLNFSGNTPD